MKLQILLPLCALVAVSIIACNRKATPPTAPPPIVTPKPGNDRPESEPEKEVYQVAGYQKTACFGKCPVYQVKFYSDRKVTWYGQHNVERMGWFEAQATDAVLKDIRDKAHAANYWDFAGVYPTDQKVADLPSTVTFIRTGDMEKTVVNTYQGPEELEAFENYLEGVINGLRWQPKQGK
ncbi:MAG: DUF6438 domain-containing protein [Saprospiraceae bacterium]|nr:DUF6438 domain-containing protein [Saprospiraceae bacterium]MCF8250378.1 DUF6438 domain-containing protein [Saprospiraceae bacterium]MCF8280385.1 DUF6438 domain-containing protein [Bacteroidales bacterium]MCF8312186.1 DUF6438 domain-containing protein [Saprospiraceae bacterium]MCF8441850.1 DUF6438 domain-containing protein [Saprospiraceae bacterium]